VLHVVVVDAQFVVIFQLVDLVVNIGGHVFVEVVSRANFDVVDEIFITNAFNVFRFRFV
jgi:hypothetical protein